MLIVFILCLVGPVVGTTVRVGLDGYFGFNLIIFFGFLLGLTILASLRY